MAEERGEKQKEVDKLRKDGGAEESRASLFFSAFLYSSAVLCLHLVFSAPLCSLVFSLRELLSMA